jgi:hypothetical protein
MVRKPTRPKKKREWKTDKEAGVRSLTMLYKLPVQELTDTEICKIFFKMFDAEALIMLYQDKEGQTHFFGRLNQPHKVFERYRHLCNWLEGFARHLLKSHNVKSIKNDD